MVWSHQQYLQCRRQFVLILWFSNNSRKACRYWLCTLCLQIIENDKSLQLYKQKSSPFFNGEDFRALTNPCKHKPLQKFCRGLFPSLHWYYSTRKGVRLKCRISVAFGFVVFIRQTCLIASSAPKIIHWYKHFRSENFKGINFWRMRGENAGNTSAVLPSISTKQTRKFIL